MSPEEQGILFQDDIREFLDKIGFKDVPRWGEEREQFYLGNQEIDAFGRIGDLYLVVDAKSALSLRGRGRGVSSQLRLINGYRSQATEEIRDTYEQSHGYRACLFLFWTKGKKILAEHQRLASSLNIALRDDFDIQCYKEAFEILENPEMIRNSLLKDVSLQLGTNVFAEEAPISVNAIRTKIGNRKMYTFLLSARHLLKFAYVFRVETNNILSSYQRLLNRRKISKIREYLRGLGFFASNILAATDENLQFNREDESRSVLPGNLDLPDRPAYLEILDGQHRLLAYSNQPDLINQNLCVTVVSNLSSIERAKLFVVVNREQTKVPSYLLWDLYTLIEPDSTRGKISAFVKNLNEDGPFKDLIRLPRVRSPTAYLSFTNLCLSLYKRTNLYNRYGNQPSFLNTVKSFFRVIRGEPVLTRDWTRSIDSLGKKGFVGTNSALAIQIHILSRVLHEGDPNFPTTSELQAWSRRVGQRIAPAFVRYLEAERNPDDSDDPYSLLRKATSSEGAVGEAADDIWSRITDAWAWP
jgi:DGQHR domain-containing protein